MPIPCPAIRHALLCLALTTASAAGAAAQTVSLFPPGNVAAVATGASTARVSWTPPANAIGFQILRYRASNPNTPETSSGTLPTSATQWDDGGLVAGVAYSYAAVALFAAGSARADVALTMPAPAAATSKFARPATGATIQTNPAPTRYARATAPLPSGLDLPWAKPGDTRTLSGQRLTDAAGAPPVVRVNGVQAVLVSASATAVAFRVPDPGAGFRGGTLPVTIDHSGGGAAAGGLIMVTGAPVITSLSTLVLLPGSIVDVTVRGTNLAHVDGLCLPGQPKFVPRKAPPTDNEQFEVHIQFPYYMDGPVMPGFGSAAAPSCLASANPVKVSSR